MSKKTILLVVGVFNVLAGVVGFFNNPLFGILAVNGVHNIIHLVTGAAGLYGAQSEKNAVMVGRVFAVVYALVAVLGFLTVPVEGDLLGLVRVNSADHIYHVLLTAAFAYVGFTPARKDAPVA